MKAGRVVGLSAAVAVPALVIVLLAVVVGIGGGLAGSAGIGSTPSQTARSDIPAATLALYLAAAPDCPGLDWSILAAIGKVETDHGRSPLPGVNSGANYAGAGGPMQFLQPTFDAVTARHPIPPGGSRPPSRYNPHDAIHAAAFYLCDNGAPTDLTAALFAYNHSNAYVAAVLAQATQYADTTATGPGPAGQAQTRFPPEQASVTDATRPGAQVTPRMAHLYQSLAAAGATTRGASCWDAHPHNPGSDHPLGKACDVFFDPADPNQVARGWQIARWITANQAGFGVHYLIWQGQIWTAESIRWTEYRSGIYGCPNPTNITGCHYDHIHISVY